MSETITPPTDPPTITGLPLDQRQVALDAITPLPTHHLPVMARGIVYRRHHIALQRIFGRYRVSSLEPSSPGGQLEAWSVDQYQRDQARRPSTDSSVGTAPAPAPAPLPPCRRCGGAIQRSVTAGRPPVRCIECRDAIAGAGGAPEVGGGDS